MPLTIIICLRRILRIPHKDHVTNATVRLQAGSPLHCLSSSRPHGFDFLDTWQGLIRHLTSLEHPILNPRAAQGLETSTRTSSSYLATHLESRSPTCKPWLQLSMEIHWGLRTLEGPRGNRYAPAGSCSWWWWWIVALGADWWDKASRQLRTMFCQLTAWCRPSVTPLK